MTCSNSVTHVAFSPTSNLLVAASEDGIAQFWDFSGPTPVGGPINHGSNLSSLEFSPDGKLLLTAGTDGQIHLWNVATGKSVGQARSH